MKLELCCNINLNRTQCCASYDFFKDNGQWNGKWIANKRVEYVSIDKHRAEIDVAVVKRSMEVWNGKKGAGMG